jgi:hypothetical protein
MGLSEKLNTKLQEKQVAELKLQKALEQKALQKQETERKQQEEAEAIEKFGPLQSEINRLQGIANILSQKYNLKLNYLTAFENFKGSESEFRTAEQKFDESIEKAGNPDYQTKADILKDKDLSEEEEVVAWKKTGMDLMQKVGERQGKKETLVQSETKISTVALKAELKELIPRESTPDGGFSFTKDKAQESLDRIAEVIQQKTAEMLIYEKKTPDYREKLNARHSQKPESISEQDLKDAKEAGEGGETLIKDLITENAKNVAQENTRQLAGLNKFEKELNKINESIEAWPEARKSVEDLAKRGDRVFTEILELAPKPSRGIEEPKKFDPNLLRFFDVQDSSHVRKQVFWLVETAFSPNGSLKDKIRVWDNNQSNTPITEALNKTQYFEAIEKQFATLQKNLQEQTTVPNCRYIMDAVQEGHKVLNELEKFVNDKAYRKTVLEYNDPKNDAQQYGFRLDKKYTRDSREMNIHLDYNILTRDKFTDLASLEKFVASEQAKIQEKMEVGNQRVELQVGKNWEEQKIKQIPGDIVRAGNKIESEKGVVDAINAALAKLGLQTKDNGEELVKIDRNNYGLSYDLPNDLKNIETPLKLEIAKVSKELNGISIAIEAENKKKGFSVIGRKGRLEKLNDEQTTVSDRLKPLKDEQRTIDENFVNLNYALNNFITDVSDLSLKGNRLENMLGGYLKKEGVFDTKLKIADLISGFKKLTKELPKQELPAEESQIYEEYKKSKSLIKELEEKLRELPE